MQFAKVLQNANRFRRLLAAYHYLGAFGGGSKRRKVSGLKPAALTASVCPFPLRIPASRKARLISLAS